MIDSMISVVFDISHFVLELHSVLDLLFHCFCKWCYRDDRSFEAT